MREKAAKSHRDRKSLRVIPWTVVPVFLMLLLLLGWVCCGSSAGNGARTTTPSTPSIKQASVLSEKDDLRAWIKSVALTPVLPNKDQTLSASADWQPQGRPGIAVSYQWFVNGVEVAKGASNELPLVEFHSGDRVHVVAALIGEDSAMMASERSRSVVIQNRPPILISGPENLVQQGEELVGQIRYSDPDGDPVTVKLVEGPAGLIVEKDGRVHWPLSQVRGGDHQLTIELEDERGLGYQETLSFSMKAGT